MLIKQEVLMNVKIFSRQAIESLITEGKFPDNAAVISFSAQRQLE